MYSDRQVKTIKVSKMCTKIVYEKICLILQLQLTTANYTIITNYFN